MAGTSGAIGYFGDGAPVSPLTRFNSPTDVEIVGNQLLITDRDNSVVRAIDLGSRVITTVAGGGVGIGEGGPAVAADIPVPTAIAPGSTAGTYYVTDASQHVVRYVDESALIFTTGGDYSPGYAEGPIALSRFQLPRDLHAISDGSGLLVVDRGNNRIRGVDFGTGTVATVAGDGSAASVDGFGIGASLHQPDSIAVDEVGGTIYFSELGSDTIRTLDVATAEVTTWAGDGSCSLSDGFGLGAAFCQPHGLALDEDGPLLWVADRSNHAIRQIDTLTGEVTTLNGGAGSAGAGAPVETLATASFSAPTGLAFDATNRRLYVADEDNNVIRMIQF